MTRFSKGDLSSSEQQIMLAMLRLHPSGYGISIRGLVEEKTGKKLSLGGIYATLDRLEERGYAVSHRGEATAERGGKAKLYFTLTASGEAALLQALQQLDSLRHGLPLKEARA
jgi:PadR family transcriptional regulator, regulatory protein PadR